MSITSKINQAPNYIQTLLKACKYLHPLNLCYAYSDEAFITYEGDVSTDISFGIGVTEEESQQALENCDYTYRLYHYQEGKPIPEENGDGQRVGVYYNQEGVRSNNSFYGLTYDLEHGSISRFPDTPITLLQLNELVQALNSLANESTYGVELLHMELGTPPLERLGYKRYPKLGDSDGASI